MDVNYDDIIAEVSFNLNSCVLWKIFLGKFPIVAKCYVNHFLHD
jgi:hypothetical protein